MFIALLIFAFTALLMSALPLALLALFKRNKQHHPAPVASGVSVYSLERFIFLALMAWGAGMFYGHADSWDGIFMGPALLSVMALSTLSVLALFKSLLSKVQGQMMRFMMTHSALWLGFGAGLYMYFGNFKAEVLIATVALWMFGAFAGMFPLAVTGAFHKRRARRQAQAYQEPAPYQHINPGFEYRIPNRYQ